MLAWLDGVIARRSQGFVGVAGDCTAAKLSILPFALPKRLVPQMGKFLFRINARRRDSLGSNPGAPHETILGISSAKPRGGLGKFRFKISLVSDPVTLHTYRGMNLGLGFDVHHIARDPSIPMKFKPQARARFSQNLRAAQRAR
jgi:hypothetical protein